MGWRYGNGRREREYKETGGDVLEMGLEGGRENVKLYGKRGITEESFERKGRE